MRGLLAAQRETVRRGASHYVLNGIAYDNTTDTLLVTGKQWDHIYQIRLVPHPVPPRPPPPPRARDAPPAAPSGAAGGAVAGAASPSSSSSSVSSVDAASVVDAAAGAAAVAALSGRFVGAPAAFFDLAAPAGVSTAFRLRRATADAA